MLLIGFVSVRSRCQWDGQYKVIKHSHSVIYWLILMLKIESLTKKSWWTKKINGLLQCEYIEMCEMSHSEVYCKILGIFIMFVIISCLINWWVISSSSREWIFIYMMSSSGILLWLSQTRYLLASPKVACMSSNISFLLCCLILYMVQVVWCIILAPILRVISDDPLQII